MVVEQCQIMTTAMTFKRPWTAEDNFIRHRGPRMCGIVLCTLWSWRDCRINALSL